MFDIGFSEIMVIAVVALVAGILILATRPGGGPRPAAPHPVCPAEGPAE